MPKHPKRPRDMMQLAKLVGEIATGDKQEPEGPSPDAVKRGKARADALTPRKRKAIAKKAAKARWNRSK